MEYRRLGNTGFRVSLLGLGGNTFGQHMGWKHFNDESASLTIMDCALNLGVNHIDTADIYSMGASESYVGKAIKGRRDKFFVASKVGMSTADEPNCDGLSRGHIITSLEATLRRLNTDYVDLYYAHQPDPLTPLEETLRAYDDLVQQGKIRYLGCSNFAGWQIAAAQSVAGFRGYAPYQVSQSPYNFLERDIESEIIPSCLNFGMKIVAYAPLAQGVLTGKYRLGKPVEKNTRAYQNPSLKLDRIMSDANFERIERLGNWSADHGKTVGELAIAWVAARPSVCSVLTGVTSTAQLESNAKALEWKITSAQLQEINEILMDGRVGT
jgi:aryl-alcohol dehydrogenase-like predicted oxidoreductase